VTLALKGKLPAGLCLIIVVTEGARVSDKRVLKLIRAFLNAGVMEDGLVCPVDEGTPQGGPITP
jgi:RNA-directed DNA polymerase